MTDMKCIDVIELNELRERVVELEKALKIKGKAFNNESMELYLAWETAKWNPAGKLPERVVRPNGVVLDSSKQILLSNGMVGYYSYRSGLYNLLKCAGPHPGRSVRYTVSSLSEEGIKWAYFPCMTDPIFLVQKTLTNISKI